MYKCKRCDEYIRADDKVKTKGAFRSYCGCGWVEYTAPYDLWEKVEDDFFILPPFCGKATDITCDTMIYPGDVPN